MKQSPKEERNTNSSKKDNRVNTKSKRRGGKPNVKREQPRKDSKDKRVNFDNERESKFQKQYKRDSDKCHANDISWYNHNPELVKASGSLPFATITGQILPWWARSEYSVPGIMSFGYSHCLGDGGDVRPTAINQAASSTYSFLVHANSRNYNYEASDLMMLILAGAEVFSMLAHMIRAYGIAKTYQEQNLYTPEAICGALGFEYTTLNRNLGQMWFGLNEMITRTAQLWIPNTFPLIARWFWMNSNIFTDANPNKAQIYMFVPTGFYAYDATLTTTGGGLRLMTEKDIGMNESTKNFDPYSNDYTWTQWCDAFDFMMGQLLEDEDRGMIFGDILQAYGASQIYALSQITADYRIEPVYNVEVLTQIENLTLTPFRPTHFVQNVGKIGNVWAAYEGAVQSGSAPSTSSQNTYPFSPNKSVLNFHQAQQPTPEQIMIATRLTTLGSRNTNHFTITTPESGLPTVNVGLSWSPVVCGTEIVNQAKIVRRQRSQNDGRISFSTSNFNLNVPSQLLIGAEGLLPIMAFDWHPFIYTLRPVVIGTGASVVSVADVADASGDYDNAIVLEQSELEKLHNTAVFSLFGVPQM